MRKAHAGAFAGNEDLIVKKNRGFSSGPQGEAKASLPGIIIFLFLCGK